MRQFRYTLRSFGAGNVGAWMLRDESLVQITALQSWIYRAWMSLRRSIAIATAWWEST
jgi:hypothetical protein